MLRFNLVFYLLRFTLFPLCPLDVQFLLHLIQQLYVFILSQVLLDYVCNLFCQVPESLVGFFCS